MVAVVESADVRPRDDFARLGPLHASAHRSIFAQREMRAPVVVVGDIRSQQPLQGSLIEHDDVIEALAADRSDHAFDIRILPRASRSRLDVLDPIASRPARNAGP